MAHRLFSKKI